MPDPFLFDPVKVVITILIAFIPPLAFAIAIRYSEKYAREPWGSIGQAFMWGGTLGIVIVILIRGFFVVYIKDNYPEIASDLEQQSMYIICFVTPVIAELVKPIGLMFVRVDILEAEDGLIYGAVIGLGYTATENLLYGIFLAPIFGLDMFLSVVVMRSLSVMFIQSSTTALTCYGITRAMKVKHKTGRFITFPLFLLAAIGIHATFNYISFMNLFEVGNIIFSMSSSLLFSIVFAFVLIFLIYTKIYRLDRMEEKEDDEKADAKGKTGTDRGWPEREVPPPKYYEEEYPDYRRPPPQQERHPPPRGPPPGRLPPREMPGPRPGPKPIQYPEIYDRPTSGASGYQEPAPRPPGSRRPPRPPGRMQRPPPRTPRPPGRLMEEPMHEPAQPRPPGKKGGKKKKDVDVDWDM